MEVSRPVDQSVKRLPKPQLTICSVLLVYYSSNNSSSKGKLLKIRDRWCENKFWKWFPIDKRLLNEIRLGVPLKNLGIFFYLQKSKMAANTIRQAYLGV